MKKHGLALVFLALLVFAFFYDVWLFGQTWFDAPGMYLFYPWRMEKNYSLFDAAILWGPYEGIPYQSYLVKTLVQKLSFPLWQPLTLAGAPYFASSHKQVLDLTNFVYFFFGLPEAINLQVTLQVFLSGVFGYFLAYHWTRDRWAALIGGVGYAFACHIISKTFWAPNLGDAMWIPLAILVTDKAAQTEKLRYFVLFGMLLSAIFLGGSDNYIPMILMYLGAFMLFRMSFALHRGEWTSSTPRAIFLTILPFALFLGLSAIRLLPYLENLSLSDRTMPRPITPWVLSGATLFEIIRSISYSVMNMFGPIQESIFFRSEVPNSFFLGITGILLVLPCVRMLASVRSAFFFWSAVASILIAAFADSLILGTTKIPGLERLPWLLQSVASRVDRVATLYIAGVPLLLALGYVELKKDAEAGRLGKWIKWWSVVALGMALWLLLARTSWIPALTRIDSYYYFPASLIVAILLTGSLLFRARSRISQNILGGLIVILMFCELFLGTRLIFSTSPRREFYPEMPSLGFLKSRPGLFRVARFSDELLDYYSPLVMGNMFMPFGIQSITGYQGILPRRHHLLFRAMATPQGQKPVFFYNFVALTPHSLPSPLLDLFNVRYLLFSVDNTAWPPPPRYRLVYSNEIRIYENLDVMPRAFIVHDAKVIRDEDEIIRYMLSKEFNPRQTVVLEEGQSTQGASRSGATAGRASEAAVKRYESELVVVEATLESPGFLVLTDSYHPGWSVAVDGHPARLLNANYLFRAVRLEPGKHRVEFIYSPKRFRVGAPVTLGTLVLSFCLILIPSRRGQETGP